MKAIVLAAGMGSRLNPHFDKTKALIEVDGRCLIEYAIAFLSESIFEEIIVVGGYQFQELSHYLSNHISKPVTLIENRCFQLGGALSVLTALRHTRETSFLLTNVDHVFNPNLLERLRPHFSGLTLFCDTDRPLGEDDMKIKTDRHTGSIQSISKTLLSYDCGYIGLTYVNQSTFESYHKALYDALLRYGPHTSAESAIQCMADSGEHPKVAHINQHNWYEIDTKEDLDKANTALKLTPQPVIIL